MVQGKDNTHFVQSERGKNRDRRQLEEDVDLFGVHLIKLCRKCLEHRRTRSGCAFLVVALGFKAGHTPCTGWIIRHLRVPVYNPPIVHADLVYLMAWDRIGNGDIRSNRHSNMVTHLESILILGLCLGLRQAPFLCWVGRGQSTPCVLKS